MVFTTGRVAGMSAMLLLVPDDELGVCVLTTDSSGELPSILAFAALDLAQGRPLTGESARRCEECARSRETLERSKAARFASARSECSRAYDAVAGAGCYVHPIYGRIRITPTLGIEYFGMKGQIAPVTDTLSELHWDSPDLPPGEITFLRFSGERYAAIKIWNYGFRSVVYERVGD